MNKEQNRVSFDTNPLVRLVTPRQAKRARGVFRKKDGYRQGNPDSGYPILNSQ